MMLPTNTFDLRIALKQLKINPLYYWIEGDKIHGGEVIDIIRKNGPLWELGILERGYFYLEERYDSESEACKAFYGRFAQK